MRAWLVTFFFTLLVLLCVAQFAHARDGYGDRPLVCNPADIPSAARMALCQKWVQNAKQPDNRAVSCCADADAYITDDAWVDPKTGLFYSVTTVPYPGIPKGTRIRIPPSKINNAALDGGNPSGHSVTFAINEQTGAGPDFYVYCYFGGTLS